MASFFKTLKFLWGYLGGRHRLEPLPDFDYPEPDPFLQNFLLDMYQEHGTPAFHAGNWVLVGDGKLMTRAACFNQREMSTECSVQVDFITVAKSGHLIESFVGMGSNPREALLEACETFQSAAFHVLYSVLLKQECGHVEVVEWMVGGVRRKITFGLLVTRGNFPLEQWDGVFEGIRKIVEASDFSGGLHWIRCYYALIPGADPIVELLVDNNTAELMEQALGELTWPVSEEFYSARVFFTLEDLPD